MDRLRVCLGDTHGYNHLPELLKNLDNCDVYHVGDFGVGFINDSQEKVSLERLNDFLKYKNIVFYVNQGNHDHPKYWDKKHNLSNIIFVPRYSVINDTLFLGGAISIDRMYRLTNNLGWWKEEVFTYKSCKKIKGISDVISHSAPDFCPPTKFNKLVEDYINMEEKAFKVFTLRDMLIKERQLITKVYEELRVNNFINTFNYGHFHSSSLFVHNDTKFKCLGIGELKEF